MKNNKGFTLVEIIVVLVILAILAAATIPSMLGFVEQAKAKSLSAEARAVYVAAQAYVTEKVATSTTTMTSDELNTLAGTLNGKPSEENHKLYAYIKNDANGDISAVSIDENGKVTGLTYTKNGQSVTFNDGNATFGTVPAASPSEGA